MEHTLSLSVSEEVYQSLIKIAAEEGKPPEELAALLLTLAAKSLSSDPLDKLLGILDTGAAGWSDQHDWHIGQAIIESMRGTSRHDQS
ncbi:MAG: hypothetical protein ABI670_10665 [Chloroflexota bacterium]